jgi:hypothetical protein
MPPCLQLWMVRQVRDRTGLHGRLLEGQWGADAPAQGSCHGRHLELGAGADAGRPAGSDRLLSGVEAHASGPANVVVAEQRALPAAKAVKCHSAKTPIRLAQRPRAMASTTGSASDHSSLARHGLAPCTCRPALSARMQVPTDGWHAPRISHCHQSRDSLALLMASTYGWKIAWERDPRS